MGFSKQKLNAIERVKKDRWGLSNLKQFRKDRDVAIEALKAHGSGVYSQVDDSLKSDKEIALLSLSGNEFYNLKSLQLCRDEDIQRAYVLAFQRYFDENLTKGLESLERDSRDFIKLDRETIRKYWSSDVSLQNLHNWFIKNGLVERLPDQNEFKIQKLKDELQDAKDSIQRAKREIESYFKINEFEFGRSQWSVQRAYESLMEAYSSYTSKKESFQSDLEKIQSEKSKDLTFLIDIEELDLSGSQIEELPKDMKLMWGLKNIDISNTRVTDIDVNFHDYSKPYFDISGADIAITSDLLQKINISNFDINTEVEESLLKRFNLITERFIRDEKDPIEKIKLCQKYGIERLVIDPETLYGEFFEIDFSGIKLIDFYSESVDEKMAKRLNSISPETVFAYDTSWKSLREKFKQELDSDEFNEVMENLDEVYHSEVTDSEMITVLSYRDFSSGYLEIECSDEKASIIASGGVSSDYKQVAILNSDDSWVVEIELFDEITVDAGEFQWSYEYTDTNDGALEQYRANCSAELNNISLQDAILYQIGELDGKDIVDEYELDYEREDEGVYY